MRKRRDKVDYGWDGGGGGVLGSLDVALHPSAGFGVIESGPSRITIDDLERIERERESQRRRGAIVWDPSTRQERRRRGSREGGKDTEIDGIERSSTHSTSILASTRRRRRRIPPSTLSIAATFALLPSSLAAPTRTATHSLVPRQTTTTNTTSSTTSAQDPQVTEPEARIDGEHTDYDIRYLTSMSTPTQALPTDVYVVDERRLPFYMTQNEAGEWTKVDDAWFIYGRRAGVSLSAVGGARSAGNADFCARMSRRPISGLRMIPVRRPCRRRWSAVHLNLPSPTTCLLGQSSSWQNGELLLIKQVGDRGYPIELLHYPFDRGHEHHPRPHDRRRDHLVGSILMHKTTTDVTSIVIKRRKQHRRAKRRAARLRKKALAAAGLTEDDVANNPGGDGIDSALREKLEEIDKTIKGKPRSGVAGTKQRRERERGPTALIRTKVRSWNQGMGLLRRRRGGLGPSRSNTPSIEVIDDDKEDQQSGRYHGRRGSSDTERTTPTVASHSSNDLAGTSGSGSGEATTSDTNETPSTTDLSRTPTQPPPLTATYFPPAYRPASVRSLRIQNGASSSRSPDAVGSSGQNSGGDDSEDAAAAAAAFPREKTNVPGYYPAPATEDSEVALAVASRSDGKRRMDVAPPDEEEEEANRIRHIATDDKQVLERMRLGASAPPEHTAVGAGTDVTDEQGPSAPEVEVDEQGFERHDPAVLARSAPPREDPTPSSSAPPHFPRPPPQRPGLSYRLYSQDDLAASLGVDERHLLPSAPPPAHPDHMVPSAPPLPDNGEEEDGEKEEEGTGRVGVRAETQPSAPVLDDDDDLENHHSSNDESGADGGDEYARTDTNDTRYSYSDASAPQQGGEAEVEEVGGGGRDRALDRDPGRNPSLPLYEP